MCVCVCCVCVCVCVQSVQGTAGASSKTPRTRGKNTASSDMLEDEEGEPNSMAKRAPKSNGVMMIKVGVTSDP